MRIISYFENYKYNKKNIIESKNKSIKTEKSFKEVLNECRKNQRGIRNFIQR
jgi:hypothetical protein